MRSLVLCSAILLAACGGEPSEPDEGLACVTSGRGETYVVGLEHVGASGSLDFKLMSALPAPPGFNDNTWIIQINAMSGGIVGAPATDASLVVTPFMPDHGHGTAIRAKASPMPEAGQYQLTPINMWMPGLWEVTITAQVGAVSDSVVYKFCIQA